MVLKCPSKTTSMNTFFMELSLFDWQECILSRIGWGESFEQIFLFRRKLNGIHYQELIIWWEIAVIRDEIYHPVLTVVNAVCNIVLPALSEDSPYSPCHSMQSVHLISGRQTKECRIGKTGKRTDECGLSGSYRTRESILPPEIAFHNEVQYSDFRVILAYQNQPLVIDWRILRCTKAPVFRN